MIRGLIDGTNKTTILVAAGVVTGLNYAAWLGWDHEYSVGADGYQHGPYEPWQVIGLALVMLFPTVAVGLAGRVLEGAAVIAGVTTIAFSVVAVASMGPGPHDGLWMVGAFMVAVGTAGSVAAVAALCLPFRHRLLKQMELQWSPPPGWPEPPPGWVPWPGWQADPSWPPAPAGHQWWVRVWPPR